MTPSKKRRGDADSEKRIRSDDTTKHREREDSKPNRQMDRWTDRQQADNAHPATAAAVGVGDPALTVREAQSTGPSHSTTRNGKRLHCIAILTGTDRDAGANCRSAGREAGTRVDVLNDRVTICCARLVLLVLVATLRSSVRMARIYANGRPWSTNSHVRTNILQS